MRLMMEELGELTTAMHQKDLEGIADALGDLMYVVLGTAVCYGIPAEEVFREVHKSNMTKAKLTEHNKGGKGPDFKAPDIARILLKASRISR